jgi:hypothetical protein
MWRNGLLDATNPLHLARRKALGRKEFGMPTYFFHVRDRGELIEDREGLELPNLRFVLGECRRIVQAVLSEEEWRDTLDTERQFEIVDGGGRLLLAVPFSEFEKAAERSRQQVPRHG